MMTDQHVLYPKVGFLPFLLRSGMYRVMVFCGIHWHTEIVTFYLTNRGEFPVFGVPAFSRRCTYLSRMTW